MQLMLAAQRNTTGIVGIQVYVPDSKASRGKDMMDCTLLSGLFPHLYILLNKTNWSTVDKKVSFELKKNGTLS